MENKPANKTLGVRTGKDILNLFKSQEKKDSGISITKPRNEIEITLFDIWSELLGHRNFGIHEDFFQVGGNSLKGIQVVSRIAKNLRVNIQPTDIFLNPTIAELAVFINEKQKNTDSYLDVATHPRPDLIPLSFGQERLWFIQQLEGTSQYNVPAVLRVRGALNIDALNRTLQTIVNRHESLRTVIIEKQGNPWQFIKDTHGLEVAIVDGFSFQTEESLRREIDRLINAQFDLSKDHMIRVTLIKLSEKEHIIVFVVNHIASDAWSLSILVNEVMELYASYVEGREKELQNVNIQYADYSIWQRNFLTAENLEKRLNYWKEKLQAVAPLELPTDYNRPPVAGTRGASITFTVDKDLSVAIRRLSEKTGTSLFMVLLAAYKVLLYRYSGQSDISVGTSIATRPRQEFENLVGFFVNTLALRTEVNSDSSFIDLLEQVRITTVEAYEHQDAPFEKVVDAVMRERNPARTPLFQVMMVLHNTPDIPKLRLGDVEISYEPFDQQISKFDITFFITVTDEGLHCNIEYNTDLYKEETIVRMTEHFRQLLSSIVQSPESKVGSLSILPKKESADILSLTKSKVEYPKTKTIVSLFEEQVIKAPDDIAVIFEQQALTYRSLNERANQIAHYLKSCGVKEDSLVPLCIERSSAMIIGMIGILKAGAAYVPIEPDFPEERKSFVIEDSNATVIVTSMESSSTLPSRYDLQVIEIDDQFSGLNTQPTNNPQTELLPTHLAYVIYTSGSTGKPKGVMIQHQALVDYVFGLKQVLQIDNCRSYALVSSIATDLGNTVIYPSWVFGGTLHIFSKESVSDGEYLRSYFTESRIDCLKIVPSHWKALSTGDDRLLPSKLMIFGGEALQSDLIEKIKSDATCKIVNHYGPTETAIGKLLHEVKADRVYNKTIPIGKPFSNANVYVLSGQKQLCPFGIAGELHIAGDGLARGYLNNNDLTAEKFIPVSINEDEGEVMYRTGDLVRLLADGNIEFIGRVDDQVKIRGYRVELGEIENMVISSNLVEQVSVLTKEDRDGNKNLVAYVAGTEDFDKGSVISYLKERLPDYMVPTVWVKLESFPLLPNGKINRKGLPEPDATEQFAGQYEAPTNRTESMLVNIWQDVLEVDQVGINDDFFELGGHSLLAVRLVSAIRKEFAVEMPIGDIFDYPTVKMLAAQLDDVSPGEVTGSILPSTPRPERIPLSFSQERLWFIDQLEGSIQYHVPAILRLKGKPNVKALEHSLKAIVNRHEVLRTVYLQDEGKSYQVVKSGNEWSLSVVDGSAFVYDESLLQNYLQQIINKPFDLTKDYMIRAHLIVASEVEHLLVVTLHHIASDAWSRTILVNEVIELYHSYSKGLAASLNPLPIQYADFAIWQREYLKGETLERNLTYWKNKLNDTAQLQLPTDYPRPSILSSRGASINFAVDKELTTNLRSLSQHEGATLFMTLIAAFKVLLHRYSGQNDICVGTAVAGRQLHEVEQLIGFFINTLVLRSGISEDASFTDLLRQVKQTTVEAYEHQELPFEKVVEAVVKERDLSRSPIAQVQFVLRNTPEIPQLRLGEVVMDLEEYQQTVSKLDITFYITETEFGLDGAVEYATDLYSAATIGRMIDHFKILLSSIVSNPQNTIGLIPLLTKSEEHQLLVDFNNTKTDYPRNKTIVDLFEEQVSKTPRATAVIFENEPLTYQQLNEKSNQLAHYLREKAVGKETLVPICIERSLEMIIGLLGILKAGAAYIPIDPQYPKDRILYMLDDTAAAIVISNKASRAKMESTQAFEIISLDEDWPAIDKQSTENIQSSIEPGHLAYIIYTSGSTGKPKGAMNEHAGVVNRLRWAQDYFRLTHDDSILQKTSFSFDVSVWELFWPLLVGARLVFARPDGHKDNAYLKSIIDSHNITMLHFVPSMLGAFLPDLDIGDCSGLRKVLCSGEALKQSQVELFKEKLPHAELHNLYGPTEAAIDVTCWSIPEGEEIDLVSIGRPVSNTEIYILDKRQSVVPIGVPGEIYIGGIQVGRGYLNRPELTAEKFIANFLHRHPDGKLYKTGDLARWMPDGNIEYLGRLDEQVKIRGFRIELGEIEAVLHQSGLVNQSVILAKEDNAGNKRLIAYVVPIGKFNRENIVSYLKTKLPDYMVPAIWVELASLPLTSNGKLNRKALPDPDLNELSDGNFEAPRNEIEGKLATIWSKLLGMDKVSIHDNFFELGGDSILTIQVAGQLKRSGYEIHPKDIFIHQTIARLSDAIIKRSEDKVSNEQGLLTGVSGLLPIQQWYLEKQQPDIDHFNQSVLLGIDKSVTAEELRYVAEDLLERHDALRFKYSKTDAGWQQEYGSAKGILIEENILSVTKGSLQEALAPVTYKYHRSLKITNGELTRIVLVRTPGSETLNRLLIIIHHLATDGVSWRILLDDLETLLREFKNGKKDNIELKSSSYRQWFSSLEKYSASERLLSQKAYWEKTSKSFEPLPVDKNYNGVVRAKDMRQYVVKLDSSQTHLLLHEVTRVYHTIINDLLLCAMCMTLSEYCRRDKIVIGLEGHGRDGLGDIDTNRTVGWFTTLYPVALRTPTIDQPGDWIKSVKEQLRNVPDKGLGYGVLKYLNKESSLVGSDPWDIIFNYLGQFDNIISDNGLLRVVEESSGAGTSEEHVVHERFTINCHIKDGELVVNWKYSTQHYQVDTIEKLAANYLSNLVRIIDHCMAQQGSGAIEHTPSDFGLEADVSYEELDRFLKEKEDNIDNVISF
jgi:amino acid adenylation domain-containing protein/non-ribosomal peptide synthase protein (TIGR01720 family)